MADCIECGQHNNEFEVQSGIYCLLEELLANSSSNDQIEGLQLIKYCDSTGAVKAFGSVYISEDGANTTSPIFFDDTFSQIASLPAGLSICEGGLTYDWEHQCFQDKTDNSIKYCKRLFINTANPSDFVEQWFDNEDNSIALPTNIEKCTEQQVVSYDFEACFDTGAGRVKVQGAKIVDVSGVVSYHLTVLQSTDVAFAVLSSVTDISSFTVVDCLCENCDDLAGKDVTRIDVIRLDGSLTNPATPFVNWSGGTSGNIYNLVGEYKSYSAIWLRETEQDSEFLINDLGYRAGISGNAGYYTQLPTVINNGGVECHDNGTITFEARAGAFVEITITY